MLRRPGKLGWKLGRTNSGTSNLAYALFQARDAMGGMSLRQVCREHRYAGKTSSTTQCKLEYSEWGFKY